MVTAPKTERLKRVMKRDGLTDKEVLDRMSSQWEDEKKNQFADFVIENNDWNKTKLQIKKIYSQLTS